MDLLDMYPDDEQLLITAKATVQSETQRLYEMVEKVLQLSAMEKYDFELKESYVEADMDSITILFVNLLDNAIKYNKANGRIHVRNDLNDGKVIVEIADTGIGIPDELKDKIFEPFYPVDKNRSLENGGADLGLSLVKQYTESMGGTIMMERTGTEGTVFILSYPAYLHSS